MTATHGATGCRSFHRQPLHSQMQTLYRLIIVNTNFRSPCPKRACPVSSCHCISSVNSPRPLQNHPSYCRTATQRLKSSRPVPASRQSLWQAKSSATVLAPRCRTAAPCVLGELSKPLVFRSPSRHRHHLHQHLSKPALPLQAPGQTTRHQCGHHRTKSYLFHQQRQFLQHTPPTLQRAVFISHRASSLHTSFYSRCPTAASNAFPITGNANHRKIKSPAPLSQLYRHQAAILVKASHFSRQIALYPCRIHTTRSPLSHVAATPEYSYAKSPAQRPAGQSRQGHYRSRSSVVQSAPGHRRHKRKIAA